MTVENMNLQAWARIARDLVPFSDAELETLAEDVIRPKDLDQMIRKRGAEFVAVVEAAKAMCEKTANADGMHYVIECEAWDALDAALRPFRPAPDPEMVF